MLSDRTKFSLAAATIAASATLTISPAEAISFRFTNLPSCTTYTAVGLVFHSTVCRPIAGIFTGDINGSTVTGGVAVENRSSIADAGYYFVGGSFIRQTGEIMRLGDVGSGYYFGGNYVSPIPSGQGEFRFRVQGNAFTLPRGSIYILSFTCNLGIERSCNGAKGSFSIRYISTTKHDWDIVISDFSWSNALSLPPFPDPTDTPTPTATDTPVPTTTPTSTPAASIPEPSSVSGLFLLGGAWLLRRKWQQIFPTGIREFLN